MIVFSAAFLAAFGILFCLTCCQGTVITIDNGNPRRDTSGAIMNAHDGTTQRFNGSGLFYYHSIGYPACNETGSINGCNSCIFSANNTIDVWTSPNLSSGSWSHAAAVFPGPANFPRCTYFRSQAVYNPTTQLYVLWVNNGGECDVATCPPGGCAAYAMATAPAPEGPFTFRGMAQPSAGALGNKSGFIGDFALFVDDAGTDGGGAGYIILTHGIDGAGPRDMLVFRLTPDYLNFVDASGVGPLPGPKLVEAPSFFKRGTTYYALLGGCTCMGLYGGGVAVLTAPSPLGPWTNVTATLDPGCPMEAQSTCFQMGLGQICNPVTQAQQNFVIQVPLANGSTAFLWTGDRWQQSPDGMYDEQPQTWLPLTFDGDTILPLRYVDNFTLDVASG